MTKKSSRPEPLFEVVIKPVCDFCNNGWMNDLDAAVEPWVIDPYANDQHCDVTSFRRWATKVAVLRSYHENPKMPQPGDLERLYNGEDIAEWKIFIGRAIVPAHNHTLVGVGPIIPTTGGRLIGATQVSWALGRVLVVAIRPAEDKEGPSGILHMFRDQNLRAGTIVAEVARDAAKIPDLRGQTPLTPFAWETIVWFYSTNPLSSVAKDIAKIERHARKTMKKMGLRSREL